MKNISDFKLSFITGMILYAINNTVINGGKLEESVPMVVWVIANILSALSHILLVFVIIKIMRWVVNFVLNQIM